MKKKIQYLILGAVLCLNVAVLAQSWFTEGSQPLKTDTDVRSLQKVNYLIWAGTGNGAVPLASATHLAFTSKTAGLTSAGLTLAQVASDSHDPIWVRQVIIEAAVANTIAINIEAGSPSPGTAPAFTALSAGNEYVLTAAQGGVFNLDYIVVRSQTTGATTVTIVYLQ